MSQNMPPQLAARLQREILQLSKKSPDGVTFLPTDGGERLDEIHAEITGPEGTPYEGGTFRLKLVLGGDFPSAPPRGFFLTKIFHPNVSANGDICVNTLKKDWSPDLKLAHVLSVISII